MRSSSPMAAGVGLPVALAFCLCAGLARAGGGISSAEADSWREFIVACEYRKATDRAEAALFEARATYGRNHPKVAEALMALADLQRAQRGYEAAARNARDALSIRVNELGAGHLLSTQTRETLASIQYHLGHYAKAEQLFSQSANARESAGDTGSPELAETLFRLGQAYESQGKYRESEGPYLRSLEIRRAVYGDDHVRVAESALALGRLYLHVGWYGDSRAFLDRAASIASRSPDQSARVLAGAMGSLAWWHHAQDLEAKAEPLYARALEIYRAAKIEYDLELATTLERLARMYYSQARLEDAYVLFQRVFNIRIQLRGKTHPDVAVAWNNLALVLEKLGRYQTAESCYVQVVSIYENHYGKNHPNVSAALGNLAGFYLDRENYYQALPLYRRAITVNELLYGAGHRSLLPLLDGLVVCYEQIGERAEASACRVRARNLRAASR